MTSAFARLQRSWVPGETALFFDGSDGPSDDVRAWSFLALRPSAAVCVRGSAADGAEVWWREGDGAWGRFAGSPWEALRNLRAEGEGIPGIPFPHGVAGFASYDAGRLIERVPTHAADDTQVPWLLFFRFDAVWAQPLRGEARLHTRRGTTAPPLATRAHEARPVRIGPIEARTSPKEFEAMVVRAKAHIRAGDIFQANLSHRLECDVDGSPLDLYARLREVNPAPFSAFFASGPLPWDEEGFCLLSASPERLFSLRGRRLQARPIAGTRRRDADPARDAALVAELKADPKERAEHVMLVDLARNDLGRVARFGSVRVPDLLTVETYRTVHHLVSVVEAELAEGKDAVDALVALFPGGTITGAPKVRAMEIIDELEPVRRAAYTGSLGWIGPDGDADFNILIRTILLAKGRAHLQVGAGIVEDSEPRREYEETLAKAKGLLLALGRESL
ncbi:MAG TPA: anthranilate synthase component I family protein [Candidatus Thermoplasmatota archaeon]|nr:anthranilate synthase component I family protein [Candidatus Thermoplasmatota archaeon]